MEFDGWVRVDCIGAYHLCNLSWRAERVYSCGIVVGKHINLVFSTLGGYCTFNHASLEKEPKQLIFFLKLISIVCFFLLVCIHCYSSTLHRVLGMH